MMIPFFIFHLLSVLWEWCIRDSDFLHPSGKRQNLPLYAVYLDMFLIHIGTDGYMVCSVTGSEADRLSIKNPEDLRSLRIQKADAPASISFL